MEEGDASSTSFQTLHLVSICCIYNAALNGSLDNDSCQNKNGQTYIDFIITLYNPGKYTPMEKLHVDLISSLFYVGKKFLNI